MKKEEVIKVENLSHYYKGPKRTKIRAIQNINLSIKQSELIAFIGPDGVGKSTLFNLISGIRKIKDGGEVYVLDGNIRSSKHRSEISPYIAYMPQGLGKNLYSELSVYENIKFFSDLFEVSKKEAKKRIDILMKQTDLYEFRNRQVKNLSGGMKQKLGLCCALVHDPKILILDEPTTGIDPLSRQHFWELIFDIRSKNPKMTVLVSIAYMEEAEIFERIIMMYDGKVIADGCTKDIKKQTKTKTLEHAFVKMLPNGDRKKNIEFDFKPLNLEGKETVIEAKNLTKKFGDFTAVDNINFNIRRGEIYAFVGPNGCGKTTTMKMITGLLPKTDGEHKIFGQTINTDMEIRKRIGYMSQLFSLYSELTVYENLYLHTGLFDIPHRKASTKIKQAIVKFDLKEYRNMKSKKLPLGVKQRLSLAVSIIHDPEILILDEPTSGVDPIARDKFWRLIIELSRKHGVTIFITTHYLNEATRCDRVAMMSNGRLLDCDNPNKIIKKKGTKTLEQAFIEYIKEDVKRNTLTNKTI